MAESVNHAVGMALHGWNRELRWLIAICLLAVALVTTLIVRDYARTRSPGVSDHEVRIGVTLALDGAASKTGQAYYTGLRAAVEAVNRQGGIYDRKIKLVALNDGYDPLRCVLNTRDLIGRESVFALTSYFGTPTSVKAQAIWTGARVPVVGLYTGARALREPFNSCNFHIRASYEKEAHDLVNLFADKLKVKRVAIFYQYDSFGQSVRREIKSLLSQHNLKVVSEGSYPRNTSDIESGLKAILAGNPEAVIMVATAAPAAKLVKEVRMNARQPILFGSVSFVGAEAFLEAAGKDAEGCYVAQVVPFYNGAQSQVGADYQRDLQALIPGATPSFAGLEGYINGRTLVEGLRRAGHSLTRHRFIEGLEEIKGEPFGPGFSLNFSSKDHAGSSRVYLTQIKNGKYEYVDTKD